MQYDTFEDGCVFTSPYEDKDTHTHSLYCECIAKAMEEDRQNKTDNDDCPCGCGDCSTCHPDCGENGQKCPEGRCLGETMGW